jgi:CRISPR/Cas system-associated exonuclease Cas4 (RecB family)
MARNLKNITRLIERANSVVPIEQQFLDDLKRSIEISDKKNSRKPSATYSPSGMGCIRAMYYKRAGIDVEGDSNYTMIGICNSGSDHHNRIQTAISQMKDNGFDCEYIDVADYVKSRGLDIYLDIVDKCGNETKLFDRNRSISFLCDGIIRYQGKYYIVEFKTESSFKWRDRKGVDPKHYNQAVTYSLELQLDNVIFVYINRDICDYKSYLFEVTEYDRERIVDLIDTCENYVINKELPPKPKDATDRKCAYCAYQELCKVNSNGYKQGEEV